MNSYKALSKQVYRHGDYTLVPIRMEDRYDIMQWRNEQIYHLRQSEPLTLEKQDWYFENVVAKLFEEEKPNQLLFSFLKGKECIGYGGLVHINWIDKNAEISFIMKTDIQDLYFQDNWSIFLSLLEKMAFEDLFFHKIYTYAFDIRPHLYSALEKAGFKKEAVLPEHCFIDGRFLDVIIHGKIRREIILRQASKEDVEITYQWATDPEVRRYALTQNEISKNEHIEWFYKKITSPECIYFIAMYNHYGIGSFRLDFNEDKVGIISYLLDPLYHGMGFGGAILLEGIKIAKASIDVESLVGYVKEENKASLHLFRKIGFEEGAIEKGLIQFQLKV